MKSNISGSAQWYLRHLSGKSHQISKPWYEDLEWLNPLMLGKGLDNSAAYPNVNFQSDIYFTARRIGEILRVC